MLIAIFAFVNQSCKKPGCMDSNATNYLKSATKDDGSCKYPADNIKSTIVTLNTSNWLYGNPYYYATINWGEITQDIVDNGTVLVFMKGNSNNYWYALPFVWYINSSYSESLTYEYTTGSVEIDVYDSDLTATAYIYPNPFKIVVISNAGRKEMEANHIDKNNYQQVKNFFNLTD